MKKIDEHGPVDKMRRCLNILIIVLTVVAGTVSTQAAVSGSASDEQIVSNAELVASGTLFEIYQHGTRVDPAFLKIMERAYEQVQKVTGLTLDTATLGPKVRVYVEFVRRIACLEGIPASTGSQGVHFFKFEGLSRRVERQ